MVFFDYEKIWLLSLGDSKQIIKYFRNVAYGRFDYRLLKGDNYILNEDIVLKNPQRLSDQQLAEYIGMCALRNYASYSMDKNPHLPMDYVPAWIPEEVVRGNPLLKIEQSTILFTFEE